MCTKLLAAALASAIFAFVTCGAQAQNFYQITDDIACGRLADNKLHLVELTDKGFQIFPKGKIQKRMVIQIASLDQRRDLVREKITDHKFGDPDADRALLGRVNAILEKSGIEPYDIEDTDGIKRALNTLDKRFKLRRKVLHNALVTARQCENGKVPGLKNIYASIIPTYVVGAHESFVGFRVSIPDTSKKTLPVEGACLVRKNAMANSQEIISTQEYFAKTICAYSSEMNDAGVTDCTPAGSGLLVHFMSAYKIEGVHYILTPDEIASALADVASKDFSFRVVPVKAAPGANCFNIRN